MKANLASGVVSVLTLAVLGAAVTSAGAEPLPLPQAAVAGQSQSTGRGEGAGEGSGSGIGSGQGRGMRGMGGLPGGARGMLGSVTEVASDHYTIKNDAGERYTVHFSANTRIMKQPAGRRQAGQAGQNGQRSRSSDDPDRPMPETIKASDIKVGDVITAAGEVDAEHKSIGAIFIAQVDPERAKQMREMQANYGKTWLAGRITAIDGTRITIDGMIDHAAHAVEVDENTSFRERRDSITLADIKPGEQLRVEGAMKNGVFLATTVNAMTPQDRGQGRGQAGPAGAGPQ